MEIDNKIELREKFQLFYLVAKENFSGQEVFQILVIYDNIYRVLIPLDSNAIYGKLQTL